MAPWVLNSIVGGADPVGRVIRVGNVPEAIDVYQKAIDQQTYKDQLDKLNEGLALAEMDQHGQRSEELDVEAVLAFAERVSLNASRMWLEANLEQRQRFQALLFPEGLRVENAEVRTPVSPSFFEDLGRFAPLEEGLVSPAGFEPALLP